MIVFVQSTSIQRNSATRIDKNMRFGISSCLSVLFTPVSVVAATGRSWAGKRESYPATGERPHRPETSAGRQPGQTGSQGEPTAVLQYLSMVIFQNCYGCKLYRRSSFLLVNQHLAYLSTFSFFTWRKALADYNNFPSKKINRYKY